MAKTIQVRVDDGVKESADMLFASLGLDTSTAIRMFLVAAMETGGIPFPVVHRANRDVALLAAIERHRTGATQFLTREQCRENAKAAIKAGVEHGV